MESQPLTKQDIAALRTADHLIVRYTEGVKAQIEAVRKANDTIPWEQCRILPCSVSHCIYGETARYERYTLASAFELINLYGDASPITTLLRLLKPFDLLRAHFTASNNNDYLTQAGLHHDQLALIIARTTGTKTETFYFTVAASICPDNSARMCHTRLRTAS